MNDKISVIIPVYNSQKYIRECIISVISQNYNNIEIVVVNDGSTDKSLSIVEEIAKKDDRIKIFSKSNGGLSDARNFGIKESTGEYCFFLDSDDCIQYDTLMTMVSLKKQYNNSICICQFENFQEKYNYLQNNKYKIYSKRLFLEQALNLKYNFYACGVLIPKAFLKDINFPVGQYFEDLYVMHKIYKKAENVIVVDSKMYKYRQNTNSIVHNMNNKKVQDYIIAVNEVIESMKKEYNFSNNLINVFKCESQIECYIFTSDSKYIKEFKDTYNKASFVGCSFKTIIKMFLFNNSKLFRKLLLYKN